ETITHLHDVGFVNGVDLLAIEVASVLERELRDLGRRLLRDDLQTLHNAGNDFMFDADVLTFGVLAHQDEINTRIARGNARQIFDRTKVRIKLVLFGQHLVDAGEAAAYRRRDRAFECDPRALDGLVRFTRNILVVLCEGVGANGKLLPFPLDSGGFQDLDDSGGDFGSDPVAGQ